MKNIIYTLILLLSTNIYAQKKVLDHDDFDIWNRIQNSVIDSKGNYVMYSLERGEKDRHLKIKDKNNNLIFDHGAHYLSKNHNNNQLDEVLTELDLITEKEILFSTDLEKNKIIKKKILIGKNGMNSIPKNKEYH